MSEFYSKKEVSALLRDVFFEECTDIADAVCEWLNKSQPESTVAAINGIHDYIKSVERRVFKNEDGD